jgi:anti-anti-sigma factor
MSDSRAFFLAWYEPGVFDVEIEPANTDGSTVVRVRGELDLVTVPALRGVLQRATSAATHVVVDLSGLTFCGLRGVVELQGAMRDAASRGVVLTLSGMSAHHRRVWALTVANMETRTHDGPRQELNGTPSGTEQIPGSPLPSNPGRPRTWPAEVVRYGSAH